MKVQQSKIHPVWMAVVFGSLIAVCSGPAYNFNAFRAFLRESGFLTGTEHPEQLLSDACKIFQTMDIVFGGVSGIIYEFTGPKVAHSLGYALFAIGVLLVSNWQGLWYGMALQGAASVLLFSTVLHISNLFERGSKFVLSTLSCVVELSNFVFPILRLGLMCHMSATLLLWLLVGVPISGIIVTLLLFPNKPFLPRTIESNKVLACQSGQTVEKEKAVDQGPKLSISRPSTRGEIFSSSAEKVNVLLDVNQGNEHPSFLRSETPVSINPDAYHRLSNLSVSVAALAEPYEGLESQQGLRSQIGSFEWVFITIFFSFFVFRVSSRNDATSSSSNI